MADPIFKRLEFHLVYACPQACVFCSEEDRMAAFKDQPVSLREAAEVLALKRREGFDHVTFTGGEPTLYPRFAELLRYSKRIGFRTYVTTNGNTLGPAPFAHKTLPWLDELCFSVHGPNREIHDGATGDRGSFGLLKRALETVETMPYRPYVLANFVVTPVNVGALADTLRFVSRFKKVRHFLVSNLASEGGGKHHYRDLAVPLKRIAREAPALIRLARTSGITLRFFGVPTCILGPGNEEYANDFQWSPRATIERKRDADGHVGLVEIRGWTPTRGRIQTDKCGNCVYNRLCPGLFERYYREFGDAELSPVMTGSVAAGLGRGMALRSDEETNFWPQGAPAWPG